MRTIPPPRSPGPLRRTSPPQTPSPHGVVLASVLAFVLSFVLSFVLAFLVGGCVTEEIRRAPDSRPRLFDLPAGVLPAGAYHGVTFFFEVDLRSDARADGQLMSDDLPTVADWNERERDVAGDYYRQLPPIVPEIVEGGREVYRVGGLHRVDYQHSMFEVGKYRYARQPKARLYVFKRTDAAFEFSIRGQKVVVPAGGPWIPSIYYYPEDVRAEGSRRTVGEVVQVALATIQSRPEEGHWLVNGKRYHPDPGRALVLRDALHAVGSR